MEHISVIMHLARVCHITHFRLKRRKSKSTKNTKKVDTKSGLGMMDIICVVSMFEHHKKLIISFFLSLRLRFNWETNIIISTWRSRSQKHTRSTSLLDTKKTR